MPEIKTHTLILCIQSAAAEIRELRKIIADGEAEQDDYVLLEAWQEAADDLEAAYDKLATTVINLPPYDELVA